ncbi:MAG: hypothetical protein PVH35_02280, partial [Syntrophobacterales bacterium]
NQGLILDETASGLLHSIAEGVFNGFVPGNVKVALNDGGHSLTLYGTALAEYVLGKQAKEKN